MKIIKTVVVAMSKETLLRFHCTRGQANKIARDNKCSINKHNKVINPAKPDESMGNYDPSLSNLRIWVKG